MAVYQEDINIKTKEMSITDISNKVQSIVNRSGFSCGMVNVFNVGSTASISTIEYESGLIHDFPVLMQKLIPYGSNYKHNLTWNDDNGHSHLRATLMGPSTTIPIKGNTLILGTWQQIIHIEFDHRPRNRTITVTVYGE